jgi:hypothetical protein
MHYGSHARRSIASSMLVSYVGCGFAPLGVSAPPRSIVSSQNTQRRHRDISRGSSERLTMADRRQLLPQTRRVELTRRSPIVHHHLTVDTGIIGGRRNSCAGAQVHGSPSCAVVTDG